MPAAGQLGGSIAPVCLSGLTHLACLHECVCVCVCVCRRSNASDLAVIRLNNLNASSELMLASGYQHTWDILARTVTLEGNVTSLGSRMSSAEGNIVRARPAGGEPPATDR